MDDKFSVRQFASECGYVDGDGGVGIEGRWFGLLQLKQKYQYSSNGDLG